jgi:iron complex outermembrane receptor protein
MRSLKPLIVSPLALALSATVFANPAFSQTADRDGGLSPDTAKDIVVTARKTPERDIDAPVAVTVITSGEIDDAGLRSTHDLVAFVPNLAMSGGIAGILQGQISMRGYSTLVRNIGLESGTSFYIDGVYVGRPENFNLELLDIAQVEVLRGPQGTEFGKNTIAGVIDLKTREPTDVTSVSGTIGGGNYGQVFGQMTLNGPLAENLSANATLGYSRHDGFYQHVSGGENADNQDLFSWKAALKFAPSDTAQFVLRTDGLSDRSIPGFFQARNLVGFPDSFPGSQPLTINNNRPNRLSRDSYGVSLTADIKMSGLDITSISAYRHSSYDASLDDDQEQVDFVSADNFGDRSEFFSQELRASGRSGPVAYLLGGYFFDQHVRTNRELAIGASLGIPGNPPLLTNGEVRTISEAAFARLDFNPVDWITLSGGLRYTHETKKASLDQVDPTGVFTFLGFPNLSYRDTSSESDLSPTATISIKLSPNANIYGRYAKGFKSAAFNIDIVSSTGGLMAGPENAQSFEVGIKTELFDRRLRLDLTGFHVVYDNLQVSQILGGGISLSNAGKGRSKGIEAEATIIPTDWIQLKASTGVMDAKYELFMNCGVPLSLGGGSTDCSGNDLVMAPAFTAHGSVQLSQPVGSDRVFARLDLDHRSSVYFEPTNSQRFKGRPYTLLDLRAGFAGPSWEITGWVENLTNKVYETYMDDRSAVGVLRTAAYGAPRTYGVTLAGHF